MQNTNWAIGPTVPTTLLDPTTATNQGLQSSSDPKGKKNYSTAPTLLTTPKVLFRTQKGPIRTQHTAQLCGTAYPNPPRTREAISASLEASPPRPSTAHHLSASLEGSEPTLGRADRLRLA